MLNSRFQLDPKKTKLAQIRPKLVKKKNDEWTDIIKKKEKQEIGRKGSIKKLIEGSLDGGRLQAEPSGERSSIESTTVGTCWGFGTTRNGRGWTGQGLERVGCVRKEEKVGGTNRKLGFLDKDEQGKKKGPTPSTGASNICRGKKLNIFDGFPSPYD